jgi:hypothetical protein
MDKQGKMHRLGFLIRLLFSVAAWNCVESLATVPANKQLNIAFVTGNQMKVRPRIFTSRLL